MSSVDYTVDMGAQTWRSMDAIDRALVGRVQAHDDYLKHEHKICLIAAKRSREDGDMAGAADFLHDAAMNRQMMIIERGQAHA